MEKVRKGNPKKILILPEMELFSANIKKIFVFPETEPCTSQTKTQKN